MTDITRGIDSMTPEELDKEIVKLLEEQPTQEKRYRRRRDKFKDMAKKARSGEYNIPDKVIDELLGDDGYRVIKYVQIDTTQKEYYVARIQGWYDDINLISEEFGLPKSLIRLYKVVTYDYEENKTYWDGLADVYTLDSRVQARYYDKDLRMITSRGVYTDIRVRNEDILKQGLYEYDDDMMKKIETVFGDAPSKQQTVRWVSEEELLRRDTEGKYNKYKQAIRLRDTSNYMGKTIPYEKGNVKGKKNELLSTVNALGKIDKEALATIEDVAVEYEQEHYNVVKEYIW